MLTLREQLFHDGMKELFKPRQINSCYFDNFRQSMFHESEEGILPRKKIRIRWYNQESKFTKEVKISSLEGRYKIIETIFSLTSLNKILEFNMFDKCYGSLKPTLIVSYKREYFSFKDLRITIDSFIKYTDLRQSLSKELLDEECVLEIKASFETPDDYIEKIIPIPTSRFSKYSRGILMANGSL